MTTFSNRGPSGFFSTWPAVSPRPEIETRPEEIRKNIIALSRRAAPARALPSEQHETLTSIAVGLMELMESPWNGEGPLRAGFRSRLCLQGWAWQDADNAADTVVQSALRRLDCAKRPTWEEAQPQPDQHVERTRCLVCGEKLGPDPTNQRKYCSNACSLTASRRRSESDMARLSMAEYLARVAARRAAVLAVEVSCAHCGNLFRPAHKVFTRRFCSKPCADAGKMRVLPLLEPARCASCNESFQPRERSSKYCSSACYQDMRVRAANEWRGVERQCEVCSTVFRVHSVAKAQRTCSRRCAWVLRRRGVTASSKETMPVGGHEEAEPERPHCRAA